MKPGRTHAHGRGAGLLVSVALVTLAGCSGDLFGLGGGEAGRAAGDPPDAVAVVPAPPPIVPGTADSGPAPTLAAPLMTVVEAPSGPEGARDGDQALERDLGLIDEAFLRRQELAQADARAPFDREPELVPGPLDLPVEERLAPTASGDSGPLGAVAAPSVTIEEAMAAAYRDNPTLVAARAELRATDEALPQARAGWRPQVSAGANQSVDYSDPDPGIQSTSFPTGFSLEVAQPVYRGGRTEAAIGRASNAIRAQRALLAATEQEILLSAAIAFLDVVRDQAVVELTANNVQVLGRQLEASEDRFRVGEITRTDVSQSESRLARATADNIQAEGALNVSRSVFQRVTGSLPPVLKAPEFDQRLPQSLAEAVAIAEAGNPRIIAAEYAERAARDGVRLAYGELLPEISVVGELSQGWSGGDRVPDTARTSASFGGRLNVPLYQAGAVGSAVREANQTASQRLVEIEEARRVVRDDTQSAWEQLIAFRASQRARLAQVEAGEIALEGVRQEAAVGSRTTLDVLDAEQELLSAQVELVRDDRNVQVAAYQLLAALGRLNARDLALPTALYDPTRHLEAVDDIWWDWDLKAYE